MTQEEVSEDFVRTQSQQHFHIIYDTSTQKFLLNFRGHFGTSPVVVQRVYNEFIKTGTIPTKYQFKYLLWGLFFLRTNSTVEQICTRVGSSHMTVRKWVWITVEIIAKIKVVSFFILFFFIILTKNICFFRLTFKIDS